MYATRHYNSNGKEKSLGTKYLKSRKEKTSPIHAQHAEEEEEKEQEERKKNPEKPKKKEKIQAKATATHRLLCNWSNAC
jgi:ATP adenylyltransferase/5',5'''-P-1,P-4-tetraphosphate phosphorylase II